MFSGMKLVANPYLPETMDVMVKPYKLKKWQTMAHWKRMNKKWMKRYGMKTVLNIIQSGDTIIAHPKVIERIKNASEITHGDKLLCL